MMSDLRYLLKFECGRCLAEKNDSMMGLNARFCLSERASRMNGDGKCRFVQFKSV